MNDIGDDEPVTLAEACRLFFGGRLTPSALRTEAAKGRLVITQIARKDFVTKRAIEEMKVKCRLPARRRTDDVTDRLSAATDPAVAQEAARIKLEKIQEGLRKK